MSTMTDERYITVKEAASHLGVSNNTVLAWLYEYRIQHMRVGRENAAKRTYLIWYPAFKEFIKEHTHGKQPGETRSREKKNVGGRPRLETCHVR